MRFYCYQLFVTAFLSINLIYTSILILVINYIDYKIKKKTKVFIFALSIFSKSSFAGNISVFEDLNIMQIGINKADIRWSDWLTIW